MPVGSEKHKIVCFQSEVEAFQGKLQDDKKIFIGDVLGQQGEQNYEGDDRDSEKYQGEIKFYE